MEAKKIKICHLINENWTAKFLLANQLIFLKGLGYEIHLACPSGPFIDYFTKLGISVHEIKVRRSLSLGSHLRLFLNLRSLFKREEFQVVHAHTPILGCWGQLAARSAGVPIIFNTIHGFYFHEYMPTFRR